MKGALFFVSFFLIFATATFIIPTPMFPGNMILNFVNASSQSQLAFLMALINGICYGFVSWAVFALAMRRISGESRGDSDEEMAVKREIEKRRIEASGAKRTRRSRAQSAGTD